MPPDWERIDALFDAAIDLPPAERAALLDAHCADDAALRAEVESLLASADAIQRGRPEGDAAAAPGPGFGERLRVAVADAAERVLRDDHTPGTRRFGPYRVLLRLGDGVREVYLAELDGGPNKTLVAVEVLGHLRATPEVMARLRAERDDLEYLYHASFVRVLDVGATASGQPYLVMEHVDGVALERHARTASLRARVELVRRVCEPVARLHRGDRAHGHLAMPYVLVAPDGQPKLLGLVGTARAEGDGSASVAATRADDVKALGAILHEVVTGAPPTATAERRVVPGDLHHIVQRALHPDPAARYASVAALSDDLERFLDGRPVQARPWTLAYRAERLVARHWAALLLALALLGLAVALAAV